MRFLTASLLILLLAPTITRADDPETADDTTWQAPPPDFLLYLDHGHLRYITEDGSLTVDRCVGNWNELSIKPIQRRGVHQGIRLDWQVWHGSDYITFRLFQRTDGSVLAKCWVDDCPCIYVGEFASFQAAMASPVVRRILWPAFKTFDQDLPTADELRGMLRHEPCSADDSRTIRALLDQAARPDPKERAAARRALVALRFKVREAANALDLNIEQRAVVDSLIYVHLHGSAGLLLAVWDRLEN